MAYPSMISIPLDMTPKLIVVHPDFSAWSDHCFSIWGIQTKHVKETSFFSTLITGIAIVHTTGMPVDYSFI
jgi:hypothetical protein